MTITQPDGFLALPSYGNGNGVLVLHAWWGLNDTIKDICTRLAEAGFVAFAPDLYHGKVADTIEGAKTLSGALSENADHATADIANAVAFLQEQTGDTSQGIAVIGFSMGAYFAFELSINAPDQIQSVIVFYGAGPTDFSGAQASYLGHFAETDPYEPQEYVDATEEGIRNAGRPVTFYSYEGTGHWFFEPDRVDAYNKAAASLAWERTLAFLSRS
jgi:carboxymethylenebutenolidase